MAERYENGDKSVETRLREMVDKRASEKGYAPIDSEEIKGWAAPGDDGYTQVEHWEMIEDGDSVDWNPEDIAHGYSLQPLEMFFGNASGLIPRNKISYDSLNAVKQAVHTMKRQIDSDGKVSNMPLIRVYRVIPKDIKAGSFRNRE